MQRGDLAGFQRLFTRLDGRGLSSNELTAAVGELAPVLARRPEGVFARLALVAGAYVEFGGSPLPLAATAPMCALATMRLRIRFSELWPVAGGGRPEPDPDPDRVPGMADLIGLFEAAAGPLGLSQRQATSIAIAWFDVRHWVNLMITLMGRREFREAAGYLSEIGDAAARLGESVPRAHWLPGLAQVLDDEPVVVIDNATGRGFRLTMSGVGDNFQLHTLLADRLIDPARGLLAGDRPATTWVAAATTAPPQLTSGNFILRRFRLFDATGAYVCPEGRPADIPRIDGARLIVLYPPLGDFGWTCGRTYEHMVPALTLDHVMAAAEAAAWRSHIAPARESDLFGSNRT